MRRGDARQISLGEQRERAKPPPRNALTSSTQSLNRLADAARARRDPFAAVNTDADAPPRRGNAANADRRRSEPAADSGEGDVNDEEEASAAPPSVGFGFGVSWVMWLKAVCSGATTTCGVRYTTRPSRQRRSTLCGAH